MLIFPGKNARRMHEALRYDQLLSIVTVKLIAYKNIQLKYNEKFKCFRVIDLSHSY